MTVDRSTVRCKTALSPSGLPGLKYSLNPYAGCWHGCLYCYSPAVLRDRELTANWGKIVRVKENIAEVLEREVGKKGRGVVGVSTVCDPYQPAEAKFGLTRRCIEILSSHGFDVCIQTKSDLVLRDADLIRPEGFEVGVTITTMDAGLARRLEPGAPPPDSRVKVLEEFSSRGVPTWVFLGPVIPEMNDGEDSIGRIVGVAGRTRSEMLYDKLNLKFGVVERLAPALNELRPGLVERLPSLLAKDSGWWRETREKIESICREIGVTCKAAF